MDLREIVDTLDRTIAANPGKFFSWEATNGEIILMRGLTYAEWMGWDDEKRQIFVSALMAMGAWNTGQLAGRNSRRVEESSKK